MVHLSNQENEQSLNVVHSVGHMANTIMNQPEVDEMLAQECEPKHLNFHSIPADAPAASSPFKESKNKPEKGLSGMKSLKLASNQKGRGRGR